MLKETLRARKQKALADTIHEVLQDINNEGFTSTEFLEALAECLDKENFPPATISYLEQAANSIRLQQENL